MTRIPYERYKIEDPHGDTDTETGPLVLGSAVALVVALIGGAATLAVIFWWLL